MGDRKFFAMTANAAHRHSPTFQIIGASVVAVLSAASWFAWMGWDHEYQEDPVTHVWSGPYETWQGVGCGISLIVVFCAALLLRVKPLYASAALVVAFTSAWTWTAASSDETGMFMVGSIMMLVGLSMATAVGSGIALAIRHGYQALKRRPMVAS